MNEKFIDKIKRKLRIDKWISVNFDIRDRQKVLFK